MLNFTGNKMLINQRFIIKGNITVLELMRTRYNICNRALYIEKICEWKTIRTLDNNHIRYDWYHNCYSNVSGVTCIPLLFSIYFFWSTERKTNDRNKYNSFSYIISIIYIRNKFLRWSSSFTPPARISLILSRHPSQSSIAPGRFSRLHPLSAQSCCMLVLAGRPAFARPCEGIHWSRSLMIVYNYYLGFTNPT